MSPKFSVVIPLYNKEPYIKRAIDSVLNQTVQDFEIIVVDDGSTDKGVETVLSFKDSRIHLIQQKNSGVSTARNRGVKEGRSKFIAFLDADDEWTPNFLEIIQKLILGFPSAGLYATAYRRECGVNCEELNQSVLNQSAELDTLIPTDGLISNYFRIVKNGYHILCASCVVLRKQLFLELGGFKVDSWWGEDDDLWGRISLKYPIAYSREMGAIYYQNVANSAYRKKKPVMSHPFVDSACEYIKSGNFSPNILDDLKEYIEYNEVFAAIHNIRCGDKDLALKILVRRDTKLSNRKKLIRSFLSSFVKSNFPSAYRSFLSYKKVEFLCEQK